MGAEAGDLPSPDGLDEDPTFEPVDPELLAYLKKCPQDEWDAFFEYNRDEEIVVAARSDPDVFMEYCFRDKDGNSWAQQYFHSEIQHLIPTAAEAKLLAKGVVIPALDRSGNPILGEFGQPLNKSNTSMVIIPREHAKTSQVSVGRTIYEIGNNLRLRGGCVTADPKLAKAILFDVAQNIEGNARVRRVFPELRPDYKAGWTKSLLYVERDADVGPSPTFMTYSIFGGGAGFRTDWLLFDDPVDYRNSVANPELRQKVKSTASQTFIPQMPPDGRCVWSATPWHDDDATFTFKKKEGWTVYWRPAIKEIKKKNGETEKKVLWDGKWSLMALGIRRGQIGDREFARQMLLKTISDDEATFKEFQLARCFDDTRSEIGERVPLNCTYVAGMDLAASFKKTGAFTVLWTFAIDPLTNRMIPVEMYRHQIGFTEAVEAVIERMRTYQWTVLMVENNGYQQAMIDSIQNEQSKDPSIPSVNVMGFRTGNQKSDPILGLPGLANVFGTGGFVIPQGGPEHTEDCECDRCIWLGELRGHPTATFSDTVMATWFARKSAELAGILAQQDTSVTTAGPTDKVTDLDLAKDYAARSGVAVLDVSRRLTDPESITTQQLMIRAVEEAMWNGAA